MSSSVCWELTLTCDGFVSRRGGVNKDSHPLITTETGDKVFSISPGEAENFDFLLRRTKTINSSKCRSLKFLGRLGQFGRPGQLYGSQA